jgi:hypothetical protein
MRTDEHGGDLPVTKAENGRTVINHPGMGCPHCPASFFKTEGQINHIQDRHPDQPHAARMKFKDKEGNPAFVDYWPNMHRHQPHLLLHVGEGNESRGRMVLADTGEVSVVETSPKHRRQGVATSLWEVAQHLHETMPGFPKPEHSAVRTEEGDAWAKKVGGDVPKLEGGRHLSQEEFRDTRWEHMQ